MHSLIIYHDIESSLQERLQEYAFITEKVMGDVCPAKYTTNAVCTGKQQGNTKICVTKRKICICKEDKPVNIEDVFNHKNVIIQRLGGKGFLYVALYADAERKAAEFRRHQVFSNQNTIIKSLYSH